MLLEAKQVEKVYGSGKLALRALKGIDLVIEEGSFYAIIGRGGSFPPSATGRRRCSGAGGSGLYSSPSICSRNTR